MQQNRKCMFCDDKYKMIIQVISESCKLTQKQYKSKDDKVEKDNSLGNVPETEIWQY